MKMKDRIKSRRATLGLSQQELADQAGVSQQLIGKLETGAAESTAKLIQIAKALECDPEWLQTGKKPKQIKAYSIRAVDGHDGVDDGKEVMIPVVDVELGAGDGVALEFVETKYRLPYQIEWLRSIGIKDPEHVRLMAVRGQSMEPVIYDSDKILIHLKDTRIISDAVFAIMLDGEPRIKRLFKAGDAIRIVSDNQDKVKYPDELVSSENAERLVIIGRAVHRQGSKGL
jgi:phage repressor protein C with HTH and peptisase S24 domain